MLYTRSIRPPGTSSGSSEGRTRLRVLLWSETQTPPTRLVPSITVEFSQMERLPYGDPPLQGAGGTLTVFDNHTGLGAPRAVRYRIDQTTGTATLLESISDPGVPDSRCCGSAKRLANGDWLIDWGGLDPPNGDPIGGYRSDGTRTFLLSMDDHYSYRAEAVPSTVSGADFRQAMNAMYGG